LAVKLNLRLQDFFRSTKMMGRSLGFCDQVSDEAAAFSFSGENAPA